MCRYAWQTYKAHFACFACRKAFKRRLKEDVDPTGPDRPARCPQCGLLMASMGLDFHPPPREKDDAWRMLESLWKVGIAFHSCGCSGPGYRPSIAREYREYLESVLEEYFTTLRHYMDDKPTLAKDVERRDDAIVYWTGRIRDVQEALASER